MTTNTRAILMFYNDNTFEILNLPVKDASLVVKSGVEIVKAWPILNKLTMSFSGLGSIKKQRVLVACENDIIFDPFDRLAAEEKPEKGSGLVKTWIQKKAETVRYRHQAKPKVGTLVNRVVMFLGISLTVEVLALFITVMRRIYS